MERNPILEEIKKLNAIADVGLLYSESQYDQERYNELKDIAFELLNKISGYEKTSLKISFPLAKDYPTAKVDVRGLLLSEDRKILLVKESADKKWSLPGGWADIGLTPKEVIVKEFKEETGLDVAAETLLAVFDKKMRKHPLQPFYVYKIAFYCRAPSNKITKGHDVLDVRYFDINNLPELSEDRILKNQIEILYQKAVSGDVTAYFD